jgi:hypothetical protein
VDGCISESSLTGAVYMDPVYANQNRVKAANLNDANLVIQFKIELTSDV